TTTRSTTARLHSMTTCSPPRPGNWSSGSNDITPQSTEAGSIWRNPISASYRANASIAESLTSKPPPTKTPPGSRIEMPDTPKPTGTSQPPAHASNSSTYTLQSD